VHAYFVEYIESNDYYFFCFFVWIRKKLSSGFKSSSMPTTNTDGQVVPDGNSIAFVPANPVALDLKSDDGQEFDDGSILQEYTEQQPNIPPLSPNTRQANGIDELSASQFRQDSDVFNGSEKKSKENGDEDNSDGGLDPE
jgi:hypothetical protein